jgi:hypothetical protein
MKVTRLKLVRLLLTAHNTMCHDLFIFVKMGRARGRAK